ncbi:L7Ae/L30e/S12e/Gadd45 family ribosomal protein [Spiroplasma endosymbiont of Amphibalanus improvisus]|uniref:L7Ae/L30e/S12e/Gadd45 family ribosomal protein n=1 Tax=Spiroplasma endosymbiont of Amphibalanus improvisus TaxID=3066327 RepID=UPI00313F0148
MAEETQIYNWVGIATKAGKVLVGFRLLEAIQQQKISLVIIAKDMGGTQLKKITNKCNYYNIKFIFVVNSEYLSKAIGKINIKAIGIAEKQIANKILNCMN